MEGKFILELYKLKLYKFELYKLELYKFLIRGPIHLMVTRILNEYLKSYKKIQKN